MVTRGVQEMKPFVPDRTKNRWTAAEFRTKNKPNRLDRKLQNQLDRTK